MSELILRRMSGVPWLILPEALEVLEAIAAREEVPAAALSAWKGMTQGGDQLPELLAQHRGIGIGAGASVRDGVGIIPITGPIFPYADLFSRMSGAVSLSTRSQVLGEMQANPDVKSIVLEIDSPGGASTGVQEFANQIRQSTKPVTAYVVGLGASAAYWIASAAREVVLAQTAYVGSIGAVATVDDRRQERAMKGVARVEVVSTQSPNKRPDMLTDSGRRLMQDLVDQLAGDFVADVATWRHVDQAKVLAEFGQGWIVKAAEAVKVGMADRVGTLESVLAELAAGGSSASGSIPAAAAASTQVRKDMIPTAESIAKDHPAIAEHFRNEGAAAEAQRNAGAVDRAKTEAVTAERARILGIQAHAARCPGHDKVIAAAIENGQSADATAAALLEAEAAKSAKVLGGLREDETTLAAPAAAPNSGAAPTQPSDAAGVAAAIDAIQKAEASKGNVISYVEAVRIFRKGQAA